MEYLLFINVVLLLICLLYIKYQKNKSLTDIQELSHKLCESNREVCAIKSENADLYMQTIKLHTEINNAHYEKSNDKQSVAEAEQEICALRQKVSEENELLLELQKELCIKENALLDMHNELEEMQQQNQTLLGQVQKNLTADNEDEQLLDQIDSLKSQIDACEGKNAQLLSEKIRLEGIVSNNEATISFLKNELNSFRRNREFTDDGETNDGLSEEVEDIDSAQKDEVSLGYGIERILPGNRIVVNEIMQSKEIVSDVTKRSIDVVIDIEKDCEVRACDFFNQPEYIIFKMRTELQKAIYLHSPKFVCKYCGQMVKISGRKEQRGRATFFSHLRDSEDCDCKTTTGRTKREIEREKYARCNEGERHKFLKGKLADYLRMTDGVNSVIIEQIVKGEHPILKWRKPDVTVQYKGLNIVFELQLTATFVSVMTERDLFYRLNKKFIIWVFNFDENAQYVDLENMMTKDVYYNNRMNIFLFDSEARMESEKRHQLVLKCNWIDSNGKWKYSNENSSNMFGIFVTLDELKFDETYKPYYYDAEAAYFESHPEYQVKVIDIEEENKQIIQGLNARYVEEKENAKSRLDELQEAFELDVISKSTKKYVIGSKAGKYGLITMGGDVMIDFLYDCIESRRNWIEAVQSGEITLYNKNTFEVIDKAIRALSKLTDELYVIGKMIDNNYFNGVITNKGITVTPPIYSKIDLWCDKLLVTKNGKQSILNFSGEEIIGGYDSIGDLSENGKARIYLDGVCGFIDSNCNYLCSEKKVLDDKYTKVKKMSSWGIYIDNKEYISCSFDEIGSYRGEMVGLKGTKIEIIHKNAAFNCPVGTKYLRRNERNMLIFKVGEREAFMNFRQQTKAIDKGLKVENLQNMYVSYVNLERQLLYLSATPVKAVPPMLVVSDADYAIGEKHIGKIVKIVASGLIVRLDNEKVTYVHNNMFGEYSGEFKIGQSLSLEKIGFDKRNNKHIWRILALIDSES